jgi:hypothetical protein
VDRFITAGVICEIDWLVVRLQRHGYTTRCAGKSEKLPQEKGSLFGSPNHCSEWRAGGGIQLQAILATMEATEAEIAYYLLVCDATTFHGITIHGTLVCECDVFYTYNICVSKQATWWQGFVYPCHARKMTLPNTEVPTVAHSTVSILFDFLRLALLTITPQNIKLR